jgi:hypothetical protein
MVGENTGWLCVRHLLSIDESISKSLSSQIALVLASVEARRVGPPTSKEGFPAPEGDIP